MVEFCSLVEGNVDKQTIQHGPIVFLDSGLIAHMWSTGSFILDGVCWSRPATQNGKCFITPLHMKIICPKLLLIEDFF